MENIAIAACRLAEPARGNTGGAMERAHEVRQVAEADVERDVADRARFIGEESRRASQPRADQVLVWRHAEHGREDAQEALLADVLDVGEFGLGLLYAATSAGWAAADFDPRAGRPSRARVRPGRWSTATPRSAW